MTIRTTEQVAISFTPAVTPLGLTEQLSPFFRPNWSEPVRVRTSWQTNILQTVALGSEQRIGLRSRPARTVQTNHLALEAKQVLALQNLAANSSPQNASLSLPLRLLQGLDTHWQYALFADQVEILSVTDIGGSFRLGVDLSKGFRYFQGARIFVFDGANSLEISGLTAPAIAHVIEDVTSTFIDVGQVGDFEPEAGMCVVPMLDCSPELEVEGSQQASALYEVTVSATEKVGESTLLPSQLSTNISALYDYHRGYPIWEPNHNWSEGLGVGWRRSGTLSNLGPGSLSTTDALAALPTNTFTIEEDRADFWPVLRLFDSRRGSLLPMWIVTCLRLQIEPLVSGGGNTLTLAEELPASLPVDAIGLRPVGGGNALVRAVAISGTTVTLDSALPADSYELFFAYLGRFDEDHLEEEWESRDRVSCEVATIGLSNDADIEL